MIESEEKALSILNSLEEICSDLERAMRILRKENTEIANALCRILVKFFWEMEYPILETHPSLHSTAKIGAKYKDCAVYKIIQYHTISKEYNIIKSGIPPEDSRRILAEIRNKFPNHQDYMFWLDFEKCFFPEDQKNSPDMLPSRITYPFIIKELERICSMIELSGSELQKDDIKLAEAFYKRSGEILLTVEGPIVKLHPSLRPAAMLGRRYRHCRYKVVRYDGNSDFCTTVKSAVPPEDAQRVLSEIEKGDRKNQNDFFYLELELPCIS